MSYEGLLPNKVDLIQVDVDKWGHKTETVEPDEKCRIEYANRLVRNFAGEVVLSSARIFFKKTASVHETTRIRYGSYDHSVIRLDKPQDASKIHHIEVYVT